MTQRNEKLTVGSVLAVIAALMIFTAAMATNAVSRANAAEKLASEVSATLREHMARQGMQNAYTTKMLEEIKDDVKALHVVCTHSDPS